MDELIKAVLLLMAHSNQQEVADLLHKQAQPIAQILINKGHGIASEQFKDEKTQLTKAKTDAENALRDAQGRITTLEADKPDLAAMNRQHQEALAEKDRLHEEKLGGLKTEIRETLLDRDLGKVQSRLIAKHKVNPEVARIYTEDNLELKNRIKHDPKRSPTVFQPGTQTPYSVAQDEDALDPVVNEIVKKIPKGGFDVDIDEGTETSGHDSKNGGGGDKKDKKDKANVYDRIRSETSEAVKSQQSADLVSKRTAKLGGAAPAR